MVAILHKNQNQLSSKARSHDKGQLHTHPIGHSAQEHLSKIIVLRS